MPYSRNTLLTFSDLSPGLQESRLNLDLLYAEESDRTGFERKWPEFCASDQSNSGIFRREGHVLIFRTESLIPLELDDRPPLLMLLGNPASHSVDSGFCFASEGTNREHRFWIALRKAGLLEFDSDRSESRLPWQERNRIRKQELFGLEYHSPFRMGIAVYFSTPSAGSGSPWAGVAGLRKLFGARALRAIEIEEQRRIQGILREFVPTGAAVMAFQRDAYEGLRSKDTPAYALGSAKAGKLYGKCKYGADVLLVGAPPTRYLHSGKMQSVLAQLRVRLLGDPGRK